MDRQGVQQTLLGSEMKQRFKITGEFFEMCDLRRKFPADVNLEELREIVASMLDIDGLCVIRSVETGEVKLAARELVNNAAVDASRQ